MTANQDSTSDWREVGAQVSLRLGNLGALPKKLSRKEIVESGLLHFESDEIMYDLQRQDSYARRQNLSYLTQRPIDYELLQLSTNGKARKLNPAISPTPFAHSLPVIDQVPVSKILKLRRTEEPSFNLYRDAVAKSIKEAADLPEIQQRDIFNDVIRPEIDKINNSIRKSKKLLYASIAQDTALTAGSIAIGVFGAFLHSHFGLAVEAIGVGSAGTFGGIHYTQRLIKSLSSQIGDSKEALDSRYYFLWKLSR